MLIKQQIEEFDQNGYVKVCSLYTFYVTFNRLSEGDHRCQYYIDKRKSYLPDCERDPGKEYVFRV